jgi:hypothetical protein
MENVLEPVQEPISSEAFKASLRASNDQASKSTSGEVMSLIKKVDVPKYFADRRAMRLGNLRPVRKATSQTEAAATIAHVGEFKSDFSAEHSSVSVPTPAEE